VVGNVLAVLVREYSTIDRLKPAFTVGLVPNCAALNAGKDAPG